MKETILHYRIDGRNPAIITPKCPKTTEEVEKLNFREQTLWTKLAGVRDEDMRGFQLHIKECMIKINREKSILCETEVIDDN